jgi:glycosyltransferase involved in cell wall biosynthesis
MKICFMSEPLSLHTHKWIEYFSDKGHEVLLISLTSHEIDLAGTKVFYLGNFTGILEKIDYLLALKKMRKLLNELKPDILHTHFVTKWGWLAALSGYHPFVLTPWGSDLFLDAEKSVYHRLMTRYTLKKADLITANSRTLLNQAFHLGADPSLSFLICFGIDLKRFKKVDSSVLAKKYHIPATVPVIFSPRLMQPVYNTETVVKTLSAVHKQLPETIFILVNYPRNDFARKIERQIREAGFMKQVRLVDLIPPDEMPGYYSLADVTLSIPLSDSAANSVLEAMACGSVPVVSNLPALQEIITEGNSGFLVSPLNHSGIAGKIIDILNNQTLRKKIAEHNRIKVKRIADQDFWMGKMQRLYEKILEGDHAGQ